MRCGSDGQGPASSLFWAGPHNSPLKLRFWSPSEEKSGVLTFMKDGTDDLLVCARGQLLLTRHKLRGAAIYSRQLYVSFIQRWDVDLTANIAPWIREREGFFLSPSCYIKRLRGSFFLFYLHIRTENFSAQKSLSTSFLQVSIIVSVKCPPKKRFPNTSPVICEDIRKFHSLRRFDFLLGFCFSPRSFISIPPVQLRWVDSLN